MSRDIVRFMVTCWRGMRVRDEPLKHIEFISLGPGRALVVMVLASGTVENRIIDVPVGMPASSLVEATNYLSAKLVGRSLAEDRIAVIEAICARE